MSNASPLEDSNSIACRNVDPPASSNSNNRPVDAPTDPLASAPTTHARLPTTNATAIRSLGSIRSNHTKTARSVNTAPAAAPEGIGNILRTIHITLFHQNTTSHLSLDRSVDGTPNPTATKGSISSSARGGTDSSTRGGGANLPARGGINLSTRGGRYARDEESIQYSEYDYQEEANDYWKINNSHMSVCKLCGST
jgi:hypothetical protein